MFELVNPTEAKLADVRVLSQKNRQPDEDPGAKLVLQLTLENYTLAGFDPNLKPFLFTAAQLAIKAKGKRNDQTQQPLDGVDPISDTPNLSGIGAHIGVLRWVQELSGYRLTVDLGVGGRHSNLVIDDCVLSNWRITPEQGGTVVVKFDLESQHISAAAWSKLAKLKSRKVQIMLTPPAVAQDLHDPNAPPAHPGDKAFFAGADNPFGSTDAAEAAAAGRAPKPLKKGQAPVTATDAFLAAHGAPASL